jgi:hypothetical protein
VTCADNLRTQGLRYAEDPDVFAPRLEIEVFTAYRSDTRVGIPLRSQTHE